MLALAEEIAGAAQAQILVRDLEAVRRPAEHPQPLDRFGVLRVGDEDAGGFVLPAPDAPAELVKLREAVALGVFDHHDHRVRHVDADLDDRRREQQLRAACREIGHHGVLFLRLHPAVQNADGQVAEIAADDLRVGGDARGVAVVFLDERADDIRLPPRVDVLLDIAERAASLGRVDQVGFDRLAAGRKLVEHGDVEVAVDHQRERARDRCSAHDERVREAALLGERRALAHAEAVLLVGDDEREPVEFHALAQQRVRADGKLDPAAFQPLERFAPRLLAHAAGDEREADAAGREQRGERFKMLGRQNLGRRHQRGLQAVPNHIVAQRRGDGRLAAADVALNQPVHRVRALHVAHRVADGALLRAGQRKGEQRAERRGVVVADRVRVFPRARPADLHHAELQHEQLLKDEPAPRRGERLRGVREVDRLQRVLEPAERIFEPERVGQRVVDGFRQQPQCLAHRAGDDARGEALGLRVDGHHVLHPAFGHEFGRGHLAARERARHLAAEGVNAPRLEQVHHVAVVEEGELHVVDAVGDRRLVQRHAAADALLDGPLQHGALDDVDLVEPRAADRHRVAPVLVGARVQAQQVADRRRAELLEERRALRADALQRGNILFKQRGHTCRRLSGKDKRAGPRPRPEYVCCTAVNRRFGRPYSTERMK